jgi:transcriptional regulator with XRE-family HTH domain
MTFGERLRQLRDAAELTQEGLSAASGINIWTIRGYEQGRREPGWRGAILLAQALGVTVEVFAECESREDSEPPVSTTKGKEGKRRADSPAAKKKRK